MKIVIKDEDRHMTLYVPNVLLFSRCFRNVLSRNGKFDLKSLEASAFKFIDKSVEAPSRLLYNAVRGYIRKNGHFTLVEVTGSDGESVKITI